MNAKSKQKEKTTVSNLEPVSQNYLAPVGANGLPIGLEDFRPEEAVIPRIKIDHKEAVFVVGGGTRTETLDCVILGRVAQRLLWAPVMKEESEAPLCKSLDFEIGFPDIERFPWADSPGNGPRSTYSAPADKNTEVAIPCSSCNLKEWGTHPNRENAPWCGEVFIFIVATKSISGAWAPALLSIQRSGLKGSRKYMSSFAEEGIPMFLFNTRITLDARKFSGNQYAVPEFTRGERTAETDHAFFARTYENIRNFLTRSPVDEAADTSVTIAPAAAPAAAIAAPAAAPAPAPAPAPAVPVAPEAAPVAPVAPVAPAAPAPEAAPAVSSDELPF